MNVITVKDVIFSWAAQLANGGSTKFNSVLVLKIYALVAL